MARAHYLAALIALDSNDRGTAARALERTVTLNPQHAGGWAQLARLSLTDGAFVRAEACLENAVKLDPSNPETQDLIGTVFRLAGNLTASGEWHRKAVAALPSHVPFRVNLANHYLYFGETEAAAGILRSCVADEPGNPQLHWLLANAARAADGAHIRDMQRQLRRATHPRAIAWLAYAIGKEAEDLERWEEAFAAFDQGAAARRTTVAYDEAEEEELFATLAMAFDDSWLAGATHGPADASPIFIVGEPRTGSTLLERMLGAHDCVTPAGELRHFGFAVRKATGLHEMREFSADLVRAAARADPARVAEAYLESTAPFHSATPHFVDKLPRNVLWLPLILAALPNARVLLIDREPLDLCFAMFKQLFADAYLFSYDQEETARHHARYRRLTDIWKSRFGERFLTLDYEALVREPETTLRSVLGFAGLSWQEACLQRPGAGDAVATASAAQVREPLHTRSVGRWRRYERHLGPMRAVLEKSGLV